MTVSPSRMRNLVADREVTVLPRQVVLEATWSPVALEGDGYAVFDVSRRCCAVCGEVVVAQERISLRHPGGVLGAKADRDSAASSAAHECSRDRAVL